VARRLFGADYRPAYVPTFGRHLLEMINNAGGAQRLTRAERLFTRDQGWAACSDAVLALPVRAGAGAKAANRGCWRLQFLVRSCDKAVGVMTGQQTVGCAAVMQSANGPCLWVP
jgi:hypothetical protein